MLKLIEAPPKTLMPVSVGLPAIVTLSVPTVKVSAEIDSAKVRVTL
jgi:hypothetical protein